MVSYIFVQFAEEIKTIQTWRVKITFKGVFGTFETRHRLLHVSPPASVSSQSAVSAVARLMPWEETERRIWTGGSSRGLSAARTPLLVEVLCWRLRSSGLAYTALSSIKQVVTLSHNFIVHISRTEGHGAMQNQLVSSDKRNKEHIKGVYSWKWKMWSARVLATEMVKINVLLCAQSKLNATILMPAGKRYAA